MCVEVTALCNMYVQGHMMQPNVRLCHKQLYAFYVNLDMFPLTYSYIRKLNDGGTWEHTYTHTHTGKDTLTVCARQHEQTHATQANVKWQISWCYDQVSDLPPLL